MMNMERTRIIFDDGRYEVGVGLGQWAVSIERRKPVIGEVRIVGDVLMYAFSARRAPTFFERWEISWVPVDQKLNSFEDLAKWRRLR